MSRSKVGAVLRWVRVEYQRLDEGGELAELGG